ncbi:MAG: hypothetical protein LBF27_29300 [Sphingobacterium sp.]|nr:hypothetical protein [Sphingobacterium sp.]
MIRMTFFLPMLLLFGACNIKGNADKISKIDSLSVFNEYIAKDSLDMLSQRPGKDRQIWINRSLENYLLGKDSVLVDRSPMALTIDGKGAYLNYRYEGTVSYFPFKPGMKDFNYQNMILTTLTDSLIGLRMKDGRAFTFVLREIDKNGMPDIGRSLLETILPANSLERIVVGNKVEGRKVTCVERNWSNGAYCLCDSTIFKYKVNYDYPVQTASGMSKPVYYITISSRDGSVETYKVDRQQNKILLHDLDKGQVAYTWYKR